MNQSTTGDFSLETDETVWQVMRSEMLLPSLHMDHAGVSPWPDRSLKAVIDWAEQAAVDPIQASMAGYSRADQVRGEIADWLGVGNLEICYTRNTTEGLTHISEGFPWQAGDNVVVPADEYPTNLHPWHHLRSKGVEVREVPSVNHRIPIDAIEKAINSTTRMLSISFVQYGTGFRADLAGLGKLCAKHGLFFTVDAIQGLGVLPIRPRELGIHAFASGGSKWLLGPQGVGFLFLDQAWREQVRPISVGWHSVEEPFRFRHELPPFAASSKRYEGGTINPGLVSALGQSISFLRQPSPVQWASRIRMLTERLAGGLQALGLAVISPREDGAWSGIIAAKVPGLPEVEYSGWLKKLREMGITANYRMGNLRFSPHGYNNLADIDRLLGVIQRLIEN